MNEQIGEKNQIEKRLDRIEKMLDCLAITNFMTEHEDGDEEARNDAVRIINHRARGAKDRYKAYQRYGELYWTAKEKIDEMDVIVQDYPELTTIYDLPLPTLK